MGTVSSLLKRRKNMKLVVTFWHHE